MAQPISGSAARLRKRIAVAAIHPASISPHSRIEPARFDHMAVIR